MDELDISREDLSRLVFTDDLTGLYNRRYLYQYLRRNVPWNDPAGEPLSLLMLDLDHFKAYNDTHGHLEGDKLLKKISDMIRESTGEKAVPIRYAGDEFTVLIRGAPRSEAIAAGESIRSRIAAEKMGAEREGKPIEIGVSIGVAVFPDDGTTAEKLLDAADRALYFSKNTGKNKVSSIDAVGEQALAGDQIFDTFLCSTYVAPVEVIRQLDEIIDTARLRSSAWAVVRAASGMGKTRLLLELVKKHQSQGMICLLERCSEENAAAPYRSLIALLDRYFEENPDAIDAVRAALPTEQTAALGRILKTLRPDKAGEAAPESPASRIDLYDGLISLFARLSSTSPLLLLFDEFQHVDVGTLEVLKGLVELEKGNVAVCAVAAKQSSTAGAVEEMEQSLSGNSRFRRIDLRPLDEKEIAMLVAAILPGGNAPTGLISLLHRKTGGVPLLLQEILKSLLKRQKIVLEEDGWRFEEIGEGDLPGTLEEGVRGALTGLDAEAKTMLEKAAVIGPNFQLNVLNAIGGRNEGETLDLLDKAKRLNLIESAAPLDDDRLVFSSSTLRNASYEAIDGSSRQELHRKVGEYAEQQCGDDLDGAAHLLAHHFTRGNDAEKSQQYAGVLQTASERIFQPSEVAGHLEKEKMGVRTRIDEATKPLGSDSSPLLAAFLRNLFVMIKNLKLYPEGSRPLTQAVDALFGSMRKFFTTADTLTLKLVKDILHVNTLPCKESDFGGAAADLARLMTDYSINSVTMTAKVTQQEIETFARCFFQTPEKTVTGPRFWSRLMEKNGLVNIDIIQQSFIVAKEETKEETKVFTRRKERQLDDAALALMKDVLRYLSASVDNIRRYPAESRLIGQAVDSLVAAAARVLEKEESFTISEVDEKLLINGVPANPKILGQAVEEIARMLRSRKTPSLTVIRGVTRDEFLPLIRALGESRKEVGGETGYWDRVIEEHKIEHVAVGHRTYAQAETMKFTIPPLFEQQPEPPKPAAPPVDAGVETLLSGPPSLLLDEARAKRLPGMMENLVFDDRLDALERLYTHLAANLEDPVLDNRRKGAAVMGDVVGKISSLTQGKVFGFAALRLPAIARGEKDVQAFSTIAKVLLKAAASLVERGDEEPLVKVFWAIGRHPDPEPAKAAQGLLKEALTTGLLTPILQALSSEDAQRRERAARIVEGCGDAVIAVLKQFIKRSEKMEAKKGAIRVLMGLSAAAVGELASEITPYANPDDCIGILSAFPPADARADAVAGNGLRHGGDRVRREASRLLQQIAPDRQTVVLSGLIADDNPVHQITALSLVENEQQKSMAGAVADLLKDSKDPKVRKECCVALGKMRDGASVELLKGVVGRKGLLKVVKGEADDVRAAAVWALGNIASPGAREFLKTLADDKSPFVRSAAKKAMQG